MDKDTRRFFRLTMPRKRSRVLNARRIVNDWLASHHRGKIRIDSITCTFGPERDLEVLIEYYEVGKK